MQRPVPVKSRKLLVASLGVATMTYVATTTLLPACSSSSSGSGTVDSGHASDAIDDFPVANLAVMPDTGMSEDAPTDSLQIDDFPVANLAVVPDAGMSDVSTSG